VTFCKEENTRFLGLDYGDKTIGVAVSSPGNSVATGIATLRRKDPAEIRKNLKDLKPILAEYGITHIVLGFPMNLSGDNSKRCELTTMFMEKLKRYFKKPVILWDERLSTRAVSRVFDGKRAEYDRHVDTMAAVYILQGYLDYKGQAPTIKKEELNMVPWDMMDEEMDDDESIVIVNDDGDEIPLQILASREDETGMYVLAGEGDDGDVAHFKCVPSGEDEIIFEMIDGEHEDFERVFNMFREDYELLGIDIEEIDID